MTKEKPLVLAGLATATMLVTARAVSRGVTGLEIVIDYRGPDGVWDAHGYADAGLTTYRLYATFDCHGDDGVIAAFGQPGYDMVVGSSDGLFHNDPLGGLTAPEDLTGSGIWSNQWDTYVTIGKTTDTDDATELSPGFATATNNLGTDWSDDNAGWYVFPAGEQSTPINGRVLLAQFVVADGESAFGQLNVLTLEDERLSRTFGPMCCFELEGGCVLFDEETCHELEGWWVGSCRLCWNTTLCCLPDGSCESSSPNDCISSGGYPVFGCDECDWCPPDLDRSGAVDFGDILRVLNAWGRVCGPEDLDDNSVVGFGDLLVVLGTWGPCPGTGACCFDDGTCMEAMLESPCESAGGSYQGEGTTCVVACPLARDRCEDAIVVPEGSFLFSTVGALTDGPLLPEECDEGQGRTLGKDVWYRYQASCDGIATVSTCDSNFDTRLAIYEDGDCPGLFLACNDDACGDGGTRSEVSFPVHSGAIYLVRIGARNAEGDGTLVIACNP